MNLIYNNELRTMTDRLVRAWEQVDVAGIEEMILPNACVDFDIFRQRLDRGGLLRKIAQRPRKIAYARFETLNNIVVMGHEKARQSLAMIGIYADPNDGEWTKYTFEGTFAFEFEKTAEGWKYSSVKFMLTDENVIRWPRLLSSGIPQVRGTGDPSFVSNWVAPSHEDRIGYFADKRLPVINPVYDSPWYGMNDRIRPEHEEELIQEAFFRYAFGIDFNNFRLWEDVFTEDCQCIYGDTRPYTKRGVVEFLKAEKQGSSRCTHTGFFTSVQIDGDTALGKLYLRAPAFHQDTEITPAELDKRPSWARYILRFRQEKGLWRICQLNFFAGLTNH